LCCHLTYVSFLSFRRCIHNIITNGQQYVVCNGWQRIRNSTITFSPDLNVLIMTSLSYHCFILTWFAIKLSCSISHALVS
jgi:hypothetical protein